MIGLDRALLVGAAAHALLALVAGAARTLERAPIFGVHPADKPLKFGLSIALYLLTMAWVVPTLPLEPLARRLVAWTLLATMVAESVPIVVQAARGVSSHFNVATPLDAAIWRTMVLAIVVASLTMLLVAVSATRGPLRDAAGQPLPALLAFAVVAGLWLFLVAVISGFGMGARMSHSVAPRVPAVDAADAVLPVVGWSRTRGDLRAPHFVGVHALQSLPLVAWLLGRAPVPPTLAWAAMLVVTTLHVVGALWSLSRAFSGLPLFAGR
jgi:hypothetical protein